MTSAGTLSRVGIMLAGTHQWKDDDFGAVCPRPLLPVANVPLALHGLRWFAAAGIRRVVVCINESVEHVRHALEQCDAACEIDYYVDRVPRGPAGCARDAAALVPSEEYVVLEGGVLPGFPLRDVLDAHEQAGAQVTMVIDPASAAHPGWGLNGTPSGVYAFSAKSLAQVPPTSYQDVKEGLLRRLLQAHQTVRVYTARRASARVRDLESYLSAQGAMLLGASKGESPPGYVWHGEACIHAAARVSRAARVLGPVMIGPDTTLGADSVIVGPAVLGADCRIEPQAVVSRSVLWNGCAVGRRGHVDLSLLTAAYTAEPGESLQGVIARRVA